MVLIFLMDKINIWDIGLIKIYIMKNIKKEIHKVSEKMLFEYKISQIKYADYKNIKNEYPYIYLGDGIETSISNIEGFLFFPDFDNATEEICYIKEMDNEFLVNVIIEKIVKNIL